MTSLLDMSIMDTPDLTTVPGGEYKLRVIRAEVSKTKDKGDGQRWGLNLTLGFADLDGKKTMRKWFALESKPGATADQKQMDALQLKSLLKSCGFETDEPLRTALQQATVSGKADASDLVGCEPWAVVAEPVEDATYGLQNNVSRFVVSK